MGVLIGAGGFSTREEAKSMIESQGLFARDGAMQSGDLDDVHWHKTSLKIYVLTGKFDTRDVASDQLFNAGAGDLIGIPRQSWHAARCPEPATYVVGFESEDAAKKFKPELPDELPES